MSTAVPPYEVPRPVAKKISRLRLLVRLYSLVEGVCAIIVVLAVGFWIGLAVDWLFEPAPLARVAMGAVVAAAAIYASWRYIGRRFHVELPADSLALLVERQYPQLNDGLVTTVQAARGPYANPARGAHHDDRIGRELIALASRRAAEEISAVRLRRVFDLRPLLRKASAALALVIAVVAFALLNREAFAFWLERIQLSQQPWPRRVHLTVVDFEDRSASQVVNVARGDDYQLAVLASIVDGFEAPEEVEIRWRRPSDGGRGSGPMLRIGEASPGRDQAQQYAYTFKVSSDLEFDVIGGDDRIYDLRLRAVERPAVTRVWMEVAYPEYMQRAPRSVPVSGRAELPEGARAIVRLEANKSLKAVVVRDLSAQTDLKATVDRDDSQQFSFQVEAAADRVFTIALHDVDGVENRDPFRLPLSVIPDDPPEATIQLRGIGSAVTPQATIPFTGRIRDDYALQEVWFEYQIDAGEPQRRLLRTQPEGLVELRMTEHFDLAETDPQTNRPRVAVQPGQKLVLEVRARDAYDLTDEPQVGGTQRFTLDVVTPSELRALLEKRELGLRQRFEAIHEKMVGVRELLDRIDLAAVAPSTDDGRRDPAAENATAIGPSAEAAAEPGESPAGSNAGRTVQRDRSRISGARQSVLQLASETAGVADGFDDIVAELINNRVDTEELRARLEQGIAEPLKEISGDMLPRFEQQLAELLAAYEADPSASSEPLAAAKSDAAEVEQAMKAVLDRMLELESYNELVELLRGIVADQQKIKEQTQQQQREKLRGLLED